MKLRLAFALVLSFAACSSNGATPDDGGGGGQDGPSGGGCPVVTTNDTPGWNTTTPPPMFFFIPNMPGGAWDMTWSLDGSPIPTSGHFAALDPGVRTFTFGSSCAPVQLLDGAGGGTIPGWSDTSPFALVALAQNASGEWTVPDFDVTPTGRFDIVGTTETRVLVFGWPPGTPGAPTASTSAQVPGWSASAPVPAIVLFKNTLASGWQQSESGRIAPDGTWSDSGSTAVTVFHW